MARSPPASLMWTRASFLFASLRLGLALPYFSGQDSSRFSYSSRASDHICALFSCCYCYHILIITCVSRSRKFPSKSSTAARANLANSKNNSDRVVAVAAASGHTQCSLFLQISSLLFYFYSRTIAEAQLDFYLFFLYLHLQTPTALVAPRRPRPSRRLGSSISSHNSITHHFLELRATRTDTKQ